MVTHLYYQRPADFVTECATLFHKWSHICTASNTNLRVEKVDQLRFGGRVVGALGNWFGVQLSGFVNYLDFWNSDFGPRLQGLGSVV